MEYLDFEIEMLAGNGDEYLVSVKSSPAGETSKPETMQFPFDEQGLQIRLAELQNAILRSAVRTFRRMPTSNELKVQSFGQELFSALIKGEVRSRYDSSRDLARHQEKGLRIKLNIQPSDLNILPWEFLYDPTQSEYLSLSSRTPVVRYLNLPRPPSPMTVSPPLRILAMAGPASKPSGIAALAIEQEQDRMSEAIKPLEDSGMVDLVWVKGHTWQELHRKIPQGHWHVFHFIGHGRFDDEKQEGGILVTDKDKPFVLSASNLAILLGDANSLRFVLLNSCEGATASSQDTLSSTAAVLMAKGIPAVLAMQYEISDLAAIEFSQAFYGAIANGLPVDTAVTEGRKAIQVGGGNTVEWGTPVLCMRSPNGKLFEFRQPHDEQLKRTKVAELFAEAQEARSQKNWDVALKKLQSMLALEPDHEGARAGLSQIEKEYELSLLYSEAKGRLEEHKWEEALTVLQHVRDRQADYKDVNALIETCRKKLDHSTDQSTWWTRVTVSLGAIMRGLERNRRRLVLIAVGLLIIAVAGVGVWWIMQRPRGEKETQIEPRVNLHAKQLGDDLKPTFDLQQLAVSRDGKALAAVGFEKHVAMHFQDSPGLVLKKEPGLTGFSSAVAFSPDGQTVASGDLDGAVRLWQINSQTSPRIFQGIPGTVFALSFSGDGKLLISASLDKYTGYKTVTIWQTENGVNIDEPIKVGPENRILAINAQRMLAVIETRDQQLQIWPLNIGQEPKVTIHTSSQAVVGRLDSTGQWLAVSDQTGVIRVWRLGDNNAAVPVGDFPIRILNLQALVLSKNGESIAAGWSDGTISIWSKPFGNNPPVVSVGSTKGKVTLAFDDSGELLAEGRSRLNRESEPTFEPLIRLWRVKKEFLKRKR